MVVQGSTSGNGGTHLGAAPYGLEDDEVRDLAEPGDVLRPREDAGSDHRDLGQSRAVRRHAVCLGSWLLALLTLTAKGRK